MEKKTFLEKIQVSSEKTSQRLVGQKNFLFSRMYETISEKAL